MRISLNEPQHNVFSYISFSQVGREILSVNVHTWDLAVLVDGESVVGDRTVEVEVESHGGADAEALKLPSLHSLTSEQSPYAMER